jgi:large subunit ribosomal protein L25
MSDNVLVATTGRETGSAASRRLRAEERIPGVVYGKGAAPLSVSVARRDLRLAVTGPAAMNTVVTLKVDGESFAAMIKEVQRHPVKRTVSHVDFLRVDLDQAITVNVPLRLVGEAKAVLSNGGLVDPAVDTIEVATTPERMPTEIVFDISNMQPGDVIVLSDLTLPAGSTATGDPDMAVITAVSSSPVEAPAAAAAEGEAEGSEATEGE